MANGKRNQNKNKSQSSRGNRNRSASNGNPQISQGMRKEFEVNIPDKQANVADLKILTKKGRKNNDISWYNKLTKLFEDATNLQFNQVVGLPYDPRTARGMAENRVVVDPSSYTAPGIMRIWLAPVAGRCVSNNDPLNLAAQNLYVRVTAKNNRDGKYDRTDLMMLVYAADSAYMLYQFLDRMYRAFKNPSDDNRYYPLPLLRAMYADVQSLQRSLDALRSLLNTFAYRLASINIPDVFSFVSRHSWLYTHVYKDANTEKAQTYMYMPDGFYKWTEGTDDPQGSKANSLTYISFSDLFGLTASKQFIDLDSIEQAIDTLTVPLAGSSYVGLMSSDIAMAFADSEMIKISEITENDGLDPQYDELVLMQMANSRVVYSVNRSTLNITQQMSDLVAGPYLVQQPQCAYSNQNSHLIDVEYYLNTRGEADSTFVAEATRLACTAEADTTGTDQTKWHINIVDSGTEIVTGIDVYRFSFSNGIYAEPTGLAVSYEQTLAWYTTTAEAELAVALQRQLTILKQLTTACCFDWAPTMYAFLTPLSGDDDTTFYGVVQDLDNYVFVSNRQLRLLHNAIVLSEFYVD